MFFFLINFYEDNLEDNNGKGFGAYFDGDTRF